MYLFFKRIFDLFFSVILIVLLSPLFLGIMILLFFFNNGEIFYIQRRIGYAQETFGIIKFATMLKNSEFLPGGTITLRKDPRVTKIGKILRISKLNELPQLLNVFLGQMSFVGPRPLMKIGFNQYSADVRSFIYKSKPGITGISSVVFRDEEEWVTKSQIEPEKFYKELIFPYKGQLERWYFEKKSIGVDIMILILTMIKIILPHSYFEFMIFSSLPTSNYFRSKKH